MKNYLTIIAILILGLVFSLPLYAMGHGMRGGGMMGSFGSGLLDWFQSWRNGNPSTIPYSRDEKEMEERYQQHEEDSAYLKYQIQMKEKELDAQLESRNPDLEKVRALHRDIGALRAEADQEQRSYELEARKPNPGYRSNYSNDWSSRARIGGRGIPGMGNGGHMGD